MDKATARNSEEEDSCKSNGAEEIQMQPQDYHNYKIKASFLTMSTNSKMSPDLQTTSCTNKLKNKYMDSFKMVIMNNYEANYNKHC